MRGLEIIYSRFKLKKQTSNPVREAEFQILREKKESVFNFSLGAELLSPV